MRRMIESRLFEGFTRKEKNNFYISLVITIMLCAMVIYAAILFQAGNPA